MKVKIKLIQREGVPEVFPMPVKGSGGAACYDVFATHIQFKENDKVKVSLGFATEIPEGYKGCVVPRSSFTQKGWIMQNSPAQIDSDYRGEWMLKFQAISDDAKTSLDGHLVDVLFPDFPYKVGDRVAQIYFEKVLNPELVVVHSLDETTRGEGGFGSTGK